jgi:hypothetical protein
MKLSWEGYGLLLLLQLGGKNLDLVYQGASIAAQAALGILVAIASLSLPRRPDVFHNGNVVDGQFTVSALKRSVNLPHIYVLILRTDPDTRMHGLDPFFGKAKVKLR